MSDLLDIDENVKALKDMVRWVPFVIGGALFKFIGYDGLILVIIVAAYYLGGWVAKWYFRRKAINEKVVSFVSWINLVTWVLPPLGIFTASLTHGFYVQSKPKSNKKYRNLALVGAVLSILNGVMSVILQKLGL